MYPIKPMTQVAGLNLMPTFPTYRGELPECLNPLNPRHYFLLAYWIYFGPSGIKTYLYQADSKIYHAGPGFDFFRTWKILVYRNLFLMIPGVSGLLSVIISLPFTLLSSGAINVPVNWPKWIIGIVFGISVSIVFGMIVGFAHSMAVGVVGGIVIGVAVSISVGVAGGMIFSIVSGLSMNITDGWISSMVVGIIAGVTIGIAVSLIFGVQYNMMIGIVSGSIVGLGSGIVGGITFGLVVSLGKSVVTTIVGGMIIGLVGVTLIGATIGIAFSVVFSITGSVPGGILSGIAFGVAFSIAANSIFTLIFGIAIGIGASRFIFYLFEFILALCSFFQGVRHPIEWDELIVLPLPHTRVVLNQRIQKYEIEGIYFLARVARNPFQRGIVQSVLYDYLHSHPYPLNFIYELMSTSTLNEFLFIPIWSRDWKQDITVKHLFLGELSLISVERFFWERLIERPIWLLTLALRRRKQTPLTGFSGLLYDLLGDKVSISNEFELLSYSKIYNNLSSYPGGKEIVYSFNAMARFLLFNNLSILPSASMIVSDVHFDKTIRPRILTVLNRLGQVGTEIRSYRDSTSRINQMAALVRATDALKQLDEYVQEEVMVPERSLLCRIIRQWQQLIITEGGELGRAVEVGPVVNPYIAGNPVSGELFVGREDILRRLEELWSGAGQKPSIVLYGHRRMGKSSILHNLGTRFGQNTEIIDFNMQRAGLVASTGELLHNLALAIYDALEAHFRSRPESGNFDLSEPEEERFLAHNPYTAFDRFLKQVDRIRGAKRFIITIDEFEMIEQKIQQGKLEPLLLDFWRGLIQTYPWVIMAFAGLHTLQEMTQDYWNPLFGSVTGIPVSFLKENAAKRLITQPSADFALDYDQDAVSEIVRLTYGQPYLVQLICHCLVSHFNRQTFEEGVERERRFHRSDVEAVIAAPEFFRDGEAYFSGVWQQARHADAPEARTILKVLAQTEAGLSLAELVKQSGFALEQVQPALKFLQRHDLATETEGNWKFTVELMRRWVLRSRQ